MPFPSQSPCAYHTGFRNAYNDLLGSLPTSLPSPPAQLLLVSDGEGHPRCPCYVGARSQVFLHTPATPWLVRPFFVAELLDSLVSLVFQQVQSKT